MVESDSDFGEPLTRQGRRPVHRGQRRPRQRRTRRQDRFRRLWPSSFSHRFLSPIAEEKNPNVALGEGVDNVDVNQFTAEDFDSDDLDSIPLNVLQKEKQTCFPKKRTLIRLKRPTNGACDSSRGSSRTNGNVDMERPSGNGLHLSLVMSQTQDPSPGFEWNRPWARPQMQENRRSHAWVCTSCLLYLNNQVPSRWQNEEHLHQTVARLCILPPFTRDPDVLARRTSCDGCQREKFCLPIPKADPVDRSPPPAPTEIGDTDMVDYGDVDLDNLTPTQIARLQAEITRLRVGNSLLLRAHELLGFEVVEELLGGEPHGE